jgi:hypothetical protein
MLKVHGRPQHNPLLPNEQHTVVLLHARHQASMRITSRLSVVRWVCWRLWLSTALRLQPQPCGMGVGLDRRVSLVLSQALVVGEPQHCDIVSGLVFSSLAGGNGLFTSVFATSHTNHTCKLVGSIIKHRTATAVSALNICLNQDRAAAALPLRLRKTCTKHAAPQALMTDT